MSAEKRKNTSLPEEFKPYFWDVEFGALTYEKYPRFIAERLLNFGDAKAVKWLLSLAGRSGIKKIVQTSRNLNAKTRNYWQVMLS